METDMKNYRKPEEVEALLSKRRRDSERGGMIGGISWYVTTEDGREVLRMYNGKGEIKL